MPREKALELWNRYVAFEAARGDPAKIVALEKRRAERYAELKSSAITTLAERGFFLEKKTSRSSPTAKRRRTAGGADSEGVKPKRRASARDHSHAAPPRLSDPPPLGRSAVGHAPKLR